MRAERWQEMQEIFDAALERRSGAYEFVRAQCGGDEQLYLDVRDMLREHERTAFLDHPPVGAMAARPKLSRVFSDGEVVAGRYRILRYLAHGGMGEVYEAEDLDLAEMKEHVALKTLLPEIALDQKMVARFKQEIALSRKIQHPNVCGAFDFSRHTVEGSSPVLFLTMRFLPGETLADRLADTRMNSEEALPLLEQMAEALDAAHAARVIHRDFKPSNVMLVPVGDGVRAIVTDFGLARRIATGADSTYSLSQTVVGTLDYMAPELLTGSMASVASDIYALGMVAYRMVTGTLPFPAETPLGGAILRSKQPIPWPRKSVPDLDPRWGRAILRALDAIPANRFSSASHFLQALRGDTASVTVRMPVITRRRAIAAGVGTAAAAGGLVGWREWAQARKRPSPQAAALFRKGVDDIHAGAYFAATKALGEAVRIAPGYALAHARLADAWMGLEMPERASREMQLARRQDIAGLPRVEQLEIDAVDRTITREFPEAVLKYAQIVKLAGAEAPGFYVDLGRANEGASRPAEATKAFRTAAEGSSPNPAAWLRLGALYGRAWQNPQSVTRSDEAFDRAEGIYQETSNSEGLTEVAFQRGVAANRRGQLEQGAAYLRKAIETAHWVGNIQKEVSAKLQLANNAYVAGDAEMAERLAREALETAQANQIDDQAIIGLVNLGNAFFLKRDFTGAEKYYQEALTLSVRDNLYRLKALCLLSLASLHNQIHRPEESAREAKEALDYFQQNRYMQESFSCLALMGRAQRDRGDYQGALDSFQRLLEMAEKAQDRRQIAFAHEGLGQVLSKEERYPEALGHSQESWKLSAEPSRGWVAQQCAITLWNLGDYDRARTMFDQADAAAVGFVSLRLAVANGRAAMALSQRHYGEAAEMAQRALAVDSGEDSGTTASLKGTLGLSLIGAGSKSQGRRICEEGVLAAEKTGDLRTLLSARLCLLEALVRGGDRSGALSLFHKLEASLADYPASRWEALALVSRIDPQFTPAAREALQELATKWGKDFELYSKRPDVQELSRPLLPTFSASH